MGAQALNAGFTFEQRPPASLPALGRSQPTSEFVESLKSLSPQLSTILAILEKNNCTGLYLDSSNARHLLGGFHGFSSFEIVTLPALREFDRYVSSPRLSREEVALASAVANALAYDNLEQLPKPLNLAILRHADSAQTVVIFDAKGNPDNRILQKPSDAGLNHDTELSADPKQISTPAAAHFAKVLSAAHAILLETSP